MSDPKSANRLRPGIATKSKGICEVYRCDKEQKEMCHGGRRRRYHSRHRGCLYANDNIKRAGSPITVTTTEPDDCTRMGNYTRATFYYEIWSSSDDASDQLSAFE